MIPGRPQQGGAPLAAELLEDATVVRAMYRALAEDDETAFARLVDPEVCWVHPLVTRLPFDGTRRGPAAVVRAAFRRDEEGDGPSVRAETFLELGDGVLVAGRFLAGPDAEGEDEPFLHECCVRDGRVALIRGYPA